MAADLELQCECARCGKNAWHTIPWLRANPALTCEGCGNTVATREILTENKYAVDKWDDAKARES
jgi:ribosomal protein L37E